MSQGKSAIAMTPAIAARRGIAPALGRDVVPLPEAATPSQPECHARQGRRNDRCKCGSGRKFKRCCQRKDGAK